MATVEQHNYGDYEVARMRDAPVIETHIIPSDAGRPFGMGEPPVPPIAPAIANAIFAATGRRIRRLPVRLEDLKGLALNRPGALKERRFSTAELNKGRLKSAPPWWRLVE